MARRTTAKVLAATMLGTMDSNALVPIIALYALHVGADVFQMGIIVGLYSAVHAPANLLFGRLTDRIGRTRTLQVGIAWDAVSLVLYSFATGPWTLALARITHGVGGGLVGPSTMSLVADASSPERKGRAMALYGMSLALAVIIGFGMAGPIVSRLGFAMLFYVLAIALVGGFVVSLTVSEPARTTGTRGLAWSRLLAYARRPGPAAGYASIFSLYFILGAFTALVPPHLQAELGYGPLLVGLSFTAFAIFSILLHYPAGILSDRYGPAMASVIGLVAVALAMAIIPLVRDTPSLLALMALFGVGHGFVFPSSSALVSKGADPDQHGVVTGLFYALLVAGVAIGAPTMAAVASGSTFGAGIWASSWFALIGIGFLARAVLRPAAQAIPSPEGPADQGAAGP